MRFAGIFRPEEFRTVTRAHLIARRDELRGRGLGGATIRHRLAALASLFEYLCEKNAVTHNPVKGVERPKTESGEGNTPAIGDHQARDLLAAPDADTVKSKRDRAILSTPLFHALRREELRKLKVKDFRHARDHRRRRLSSGAALFGAAGVSDRRARAARDRRNQCARLPGRHRQGARMARPCQHRHHAHLRPQTHATRRQPDVQSCLLTNMRSYR